MKKKIKDLTYDEALRVCENRDRETAERHCFECPLFETIKCIQSKEMKLEREIEVDE